MIFHKSIIPNLFTLSSLFNGFLSIIASSQGRFRLAALLIIFGMLFDFMDGRVARLLHADSDIGKELDSLADLVTFGVAPAFLIYSNSLRSFPISGVIIAGLFPIGVALRLARFNTKTAEKRKSFTGIPSTLAGGFIAFLYGFFKHQPLNIMLILTVIITILMISPFQYYKIPKLPLHSIKNIKIAITVILSILLLLKYNKYLLLIGGIGYMMSGIVIYIAKKVSFAIERHRELKEENDRDMNHII